MKRTTKIAVTAAAMAMPIALVLSGCSSDGGNGGGGSGDENTLTVWTWDPAFNIYAMQEAEKVYQQDNPDFKLEIVETPGTTCRPSSRRSRSRRSSTSSRHPAHAEQRVPEEPHQLPGRLHRHHRLGHRLLGVPQAVADYSTLDGASYGVPFDAGTAIGAYRTDVLAEAGYTIEDFTDITWSEFQTKAEDVLAKTGKPLLSGQAGSSDMIMMMLQSAGASLFDKEGNPTIADNAVLEEAIEVYANLVKSGVFVEVNSWDEYISTFVNGSVAGTINGVWIVGSIQTAEDQAGNWGVTNLPKLDGVSGATNYSANGGSSWVVTSNANVDLATDFLAKTFGGSTELYDTILPKAGAVANWIPAGDSDVYGQPVDFFGGQAIFADVVAFGAEVPSNNTGVYYYEGRDSVSAAITKIIGGADVKTSLEEAQATVEFAMG